MSWDQRFYDPIPLPGQKALVTLRHAARYITKLPKAELGSSARRRNDAVDLGAPA